VTQSAQILEAASGAGWQPQRLVLTLLTALLIVASLGLMRWGWAGRARRQSDILPLPPVPPVPAGGTGHSDQPVTRATGRYLGATRAGEWLDRVVVHGLGVPSNAHIVVTGTGTWILRDGAPDLFISAGELGGVRHDRAGAGRVFEADGVLVITWNHGGTAIDLVLRIPDASASESVRSAIALASHSSSITTPGDNA